MAEELDEIAAIGVQLPLNLNDIINPADEYAVEAENLSVALNGAISEELSDPGQ
jgi:hypothetical protein